MSRSIREKRRYGHVGVGEREREVVKGTYIEREVSG